MSNGSTDVVRLSFALRPAEPLYSAIIGASQAITDDFDNQNIIDDKQFPPHLSLHICTVPLTARDVLFDELRASIDHAALPALKPARVAKGSRGYVSLDIERTPELMSMHELVLEAAAHARSGLEEDPRHHGRSLSGQQQSNYDTYGNAFVKDAFEPHFSVAKVDDYDQPEALRLAEQHLGQLGGASSAAFEVADIGMRNEKWDVSLCIR